MTNNTRSAPRHLDFRASDTFLLDSVAALSSPAYPTREVGMPSTINPLAHGRRESYQQSA